MNTRLQQRDMDIITTLGEVGMMSYNQIMQKYFPSRMAAYNRCGKLLKEKYIKAEYSPTGEKVFVLGKEGHTITGEEYRRETFANAGHKIMRADLYMSIRENCDISSWACEKPCSIGKHKIYFDARFHFEDDLYLCEVLNAQTTTKLKDKIIKCLDSDFPFVLLVYCREKGNVNAMWERLKESGRLPHHSRRPFVLQVYQHGYPVDL